MPDLVPAIDLSDTPKFTTPPVIETSLGVQFKPLASMRIIHFGLFFELLREQGFETCEEQQKLPRVVEQEKQELRTLSFSLAPPSQLPRVWYLSKDTEEGQQVIQLQNDKLLQNWRRNPKGSASYTSHRQSLQSFKDTYSSFIKFVEDERIGSVVPDQCEVMYANQISLAGFDSPKAAFAQCFRNRAGFGDYRHLPSEPDAIGMNWSYWLEALQGRLYVEANTAIVAGTDEKVIDLRLNARGASSNPSTQGITDWLNYGHYFVVNAFADITSEQMHNKWGRTR